MYRIGQEEIDAVARVIDSRLLFKINNGLQETLHAESDVFFGRGVSFMLAYRCGKQHQRNGNSAKLQVWMIGTNRLECRKV